MHLDQVREMMIANDRPELEQIHGGVIQLWEDGEITYQKSGDLLWNRSLHSFDRGYDSIKIPNLPHSYNGFGYVVIESHELARKIRVEMFPEDHVERKLYNEIYAPGKSGHNSPQI